MVAAYPTPLNNGHIFHTPITPRFNDWPKATFQLYLKIKIFEFKAYFYLNKFNFKPSIKNMGIPPKTNARKYGTKKAP